MNNMTGDSNQLFWATGINNSRLKSDSGEAIKIFRDLSSSVKSELQSIANAYKKVQNTANVKFTNPVDKRMVSEIKSQLSQLDKVIDAQIQKLGRFSSSYESAMRKVVQSTSKVGQGVEMPDVLTPHVEKIKKNVREADNQMNFLTRMYKYALTKFATYGSINLVKDFITQTVSVSGQFDMLRVAIDSFVGSADTGKQVFHELMNLAVKSPFQLMDIADSAKQLLAYGFAAQDVTKNVKMMSEVAAGSGQSIRDISYLYGTSLTQGRLYTRDLFQFANRGVPIYKELASVMGVSTEKLSKLVTAGKVGFPELQKAIENMTSAGGLYYGLSDKLAETTYGKISNLKDKWAIAMDEIGHSNAGVINGVVNLTTTLIENWQQVLTSLEAVIIGYGSYRAAIILVTLLTQNLATTMMELSMVIAKVSAVMAATDPIYLVAAAIGACIGAYIMFVDHSTAAEKAQKRFNDTMKSSDNFVSSQERLVGDLLDVIKRETSSIYAKQAAYDKLNSMYPGILKNMSLEQVMLMRSVDLQQKYNEKIESNARIGVRTNAILAGNRYEKLRISYNSLSKSTETSAESKKALKDQMDEAAEEWVLYRKAVKQMDDTIDAINKAKKKKGEGVTHDYEYWKQLRDKAHEEKTALDVSEANTAKFKKLSSEEQNAQDMMDKYSIKKDAANAKAAQREKEKENKEAVRNADRLKKVADNERELKNMSVEAEENLASAKIEAMDEGFIKQQARIDSNYEKQKQKAEEKTQLLIKKAQEDEKLIWQTQHPDSAKKGQIFKTTITGVMDLSEQDQKTSKNMFEAAAAERVAATKKLVDDLLKQYQDFDAQRYEAQKKANDDLDALEASRTVLNSDKIDSAKKQVGVNLADKMASINMEQFKKDMDWGTIFSDLDNVATPTLERLAKKARELAPSITAGMEPESVKTFMKSIDELENKLITRNPFKSLSGSMDEYVVASKEVKDKQAQLNKITEGGTVLVSEYDKATDRVIYRLKTQKEAEDELAKAKNKKQSAAEKATKSVNDIGKTGQQAVGAANDVISTLEILGVSVSGNTKNVISGVGDIMEGLSTVNFTNPMSVVTASLKVMKGEAEIVVGLFGGKSKGTEYFESLKASLETYMSVLDSVISKQKKLISDMSGATALAQSEKVKANIEKEVAAYRELAKAAGGAGADIGSHSYAYRTNKALSDSWYAISKSAGVTVRSIDDLYSMSASKLEKVMTENPLAWSKISEDIRTYLEKIIEAGDTIEETTDAANEALLGLSFDSAKSSLDDFITDADKSLSDVSDNFETYMKKAMLNIIKSKYLTEALTKWYDEFASAASDSAITEDEATKLKEEYINIFKTGRDMYDQMASVAGTSSSSSSSLEEAIKGMSEESADILTAQFSAIRVNVSDILLTLVSHSNAMQLAANDISEIAKNTKNLFDILDEIKKINSVGVKMR